MVNANISAFFLRAGYAAVAYDVALVTRKPPLSRKKTWTLESSDRGSKKYSLSDDDGIWFKKAVCCDGRRPMGKQ
jgi:hypothetical protein